MVPLRPRLAALPGFRLGVGVDPGPGSVLALPSSITNALGVAFTALVALVACGLTCTAAPGGPAEDPVRTEGHAPVVASADLLDRWLQRQSAVRTWSAEFTQVRRLKTLAQPLTARGRVRFAAPNRFHWEIGDPVQTLAVRQSNSVLIVYPALRRAERYPVDGASTGPWKQMLSLLEVGFPESRAQLEARFRVLARDSSATTHELALEPRAAAVRRLMPRFKIVLSEPDLELVATEMEFADGSSLRNDFARITTNPVLDDRLFEPELGPDFRVTEPLSRPRP